MAKFLTVLVANRLHELFGELERVEYNINQVKVGNRFSPTGTMEHFEEAQELIKSEIAELETFLGKEKATMVRDLNNTIEALGSDRYDINLHAAEIGYRNTSDAYGDPRIVAIREERKQLRETITRLKEALGYTEPNIGPIVILTPVKENLVTFKYDKENDLPF